MSARGRGRGFAAVVVSAGVVAAVFAVAPTGSRAAEEGTKGAATGTGTITIGLYAPSAPFDGPEARLDFVSRLATHVQGKLGGGATPVVGRVYARAADFSAAVKRGEVTVALVDAPYLAGAGASWPVLASVTRGGAAVGAWQLACTGVTGHGLAAARGKTVILPNIGARADAFLANALMEGEAEPGFFAKVTFAPDALSAVAAVGLARADCAAVPAGLALPAGVTPLIGLREVPWPLLVALPGGDAKTTEAVAAAALSFHPGGVFDGFTAARAGDLHDLAAAFGKPEHKGATLVPAPRLDVAAILGDRTFTLSRSDLSIAGLAVLPPSPSPAASPSTPSAPRK